MLKPPHMKKILTAISVSSLFSFHPASLASGFALIEQSASGQGLSYAGAGIMADDASIMWFNAAQMTQIQNRQLVGALHFIDPKLAFKNQDSNTSGPNSDGGNLGVVPNFYWKDQFNNTHLGLGINVPYGQHLDYGETWVGRYHATETNLTTLQINTNIAQALNQVWSIGFGLNAQYVDVLLAQKINQSALGEPDANAKVTGNNWSYGYNLGLSYHPKNAFQLGLSYRSAIKQKVEGEVVYENVSQTPLPNLGGASLANIFTDAKAVASVTLPASASIAVSYPINPKTLLLADATWTQWSHYDQLIVEFNNAAPDSKSNQNFKDAWRYALGASYQANNQLKLRTGIALDKTPVPNAQSRSPRTPDSDRYWFSIGAGYLLRPNLTFDLAYSFIYASEAKIDYTQPSALGDSQLRGTVDASISILSAQIVWRY